MRLRVFPAAQADADAALDWYNNAVAGLGEEFIAELESALALLLTQPGMGSKRYAYLLDDSTLRFWAIGRFPFLVFYRVEGDYLTVLRILHERRDIQTAWMVH
jgi:toxin ParE1/3/4